jgi:hypothetical protein
MHLDTKKLGRIDGVGKRFGGPRRSRALGWNYVHVAIDDHSRLAYAEELPDELGPTATAFTMRAIAFFHSLGIRVRGWTYRRPYASSEERADALSEFLRTYNHYLRTEGLTTPGRDRVRQ